MSNPNIRKTLLISALLASSFLTACGGGDSGGDSNPIQQPPSEQPPSNGGGGTPGGGNPGNPGGGDPTGGNGRYPNSQSGTSGKWQAPTSYPAEKAPFQEAGPKFAPTMRYQNSVSNEIITALTDPGRVFTSAVSGIERSASNFLRNVPRPRKVQYELPKVYDGATGRTMRTIGAYDAYARGITGQNVVVGVVDSGFSGEGIHLQGKIKAFRNYVPDSQQTKFSHGDSVSMIIAGKSHNTWQFNTGYVGGIAPDAQVSQAHLFDTDGSVSYSTFASVYENMLADGVSIINHSIGTKSWDLPINGSSTSPGLKYLSDLTSKYVEDHGMLLVWSASNNSLDYPGNWGSLQLMDKRLQTGGYLTVVAVDDNGTLESYSNKCGPVASWCLAAPVRVHMPNLSDSMGSHNFAGTSAAAPVVSGAAALVKQAFPYMKGDQIGQVILGTASDLGAPGVDPVFGYGMLDVAKAIRGPGKFDWGDFNVSLVGGSTWENDISGAGGLVKNGTGILRLTGQNSYTGGTNVNNGALVVTGSIGGQTFISENGILGGNGSLGSVTSKGILHAGWPYTGTLNINGNYVNDGGALSVVLGSKVNVTGTTTINGGLLAIDGVENSYARTGEFSILTSNQGITGDFDKFDFRSSYLVNGAYSLTGNDIVISHDTTALNTESVCVTGNGCMSANIIENAVDKEAEKTDTDTAVVLASNDLIKLGVGIQQLDTVQAVRNALEEISGNIHPTMVQAGLVSIDVPMSRISTRLDQLRWDRNYSTNFWTDGIGGTGGLRGSNGIANADYTLGGVVFGVDKRISDQVVGGVYAGWNTMKVEVSGQSHDNNIDTYFGGAYVGLNYDKWILNGQVAYGRQDYEVSRSIFNMGDRLNSDYHGNVYAAKVELGYDIAQYGAYTITPYVAGTYIYSRTDGFNETGLGGLTSGKSSTDLFRPEAGIKIGGKQKLKNGNLGVYGKVAITHDKTKSNRNMYIGDTEFTADGARRGKTNVVIGLNTQYDFKNNLSLFGGAEVQIPTSGGKTATSFNVGLKIKF